jgi:class 3 adenylate cyclase
MAAPIKKSFGQPDQQVALPGIHAEVVDVSDATITKSSFEPGTHCPQIGVEGKATCLAHHTGYAIAGGLHVEMKDGSTIDVGADDVFDIPPGHDGVSTGPLPFLAINWAGARTWMSERAGERVVLTLLITDVVDSTARALKIGDQEWRELLAMHYRSVRNVLDRYRGREIKTAGDGVIAAFDSAGRAVLSAIAIRDRARSDEVPVRLGVHSGEVELVGDDIAGVTVHEAARIAAAAGRDEILLSEATRLLATGAPFAVEPRGPFELKGLPGERTLYAVTSTAPEAEMM